MKRSVAADGLPRTEVFTPDSKGKRYREYYSTLSHETLEMIADPGVNLYASGYYIRHERLRGARVVRAGARAALHEVQLVRLCSATFRSELRRLHRRCGRP